MSEILGDKLNIVYEGTLLEITPELMKKTIVNQNKEIERLHSIIKEVIEKANIIQFTIESNDKRYGNLYVKLKDTQQGQELLEILDKENK